MRVAWCCKWLPPQGEDTAAARALNLRSTTATALAKLSRPQAVARLLGLLRENLAALQAQIRFCAGRPPIERALRIGSNLLPLYTHPVARPLYDEPALREVLERELGLAGRLARDAAVRLSMHPGQFTVLATESETALRNSVEEIEYHTEVMRLMGHSGGWHPEGAHINVHGGARGPGVAGFRVGFALLSAEARGLLTVENDEVIYGFDDLLPLADTLPIVLDLHHHWVKSEGEHIWPDDPRIAAVQESWRGTRPVGHISAPRRELMPDWPEQVLPDYGKLLAMGVSARDLRGHSDMIWNSAIAAWAGAHLSWMDLEIEAKHKNIASADFAARLGGACAA